MDNAKWIFLSVPVRRWLARPMLLVAAGALIASSAGCAEDSVGSRSVVHMTGDISPSSDRSPHPLGRISTTTKVVAASTAAAAAVAAAVLVVQATNSSPVSHGAAPSAQVPSSATHSSAAALSSASGDASPTTTAPQTMSAAATSASGPRVFLVDPHRVAEQKAAYIAKDAQATAAVQLLIKRANKDLSIAPVAVTDKTQVPPSGDKHDYMSLSIYAWPNPRTANGLPYIIKDGDKNPAADDISDKNDLVKVIDAAQELGYAFYFTGNQAYATQAAKLLTAWFLTPATKMNPNLTFAQAVPGTSNGQSGGIIDTADLPKVIDAVGLLAGSKSWSAADTTALKSWFSTFLTWLRTSPQGKAEAATSNNHATWYDDQVLSYALFTGQTALATSIAKGAESSIIARQIEPDGTQPEEITRATSWSYSTYNVEALARLAQEASAVNIDLWHYTAPNGASIKAALDYVDSYIGRLSRWPYPQSGTATLQYLPLALSAAAQVYRGGNYASLANTAIAASSNLYPAASLVFGPTS